MDPAVTRLKAALAAVGPGALAAPSRVRAALLDLGPEARRDANVLVAALREGVVAGLGACSGALDPQTEQRLSARVVERAGLSPELGTWAVRIWAAALGEGRAAARSASRPASRPVAWPVVAMSRSRTALDQWHCLTGHEGRVLALAFSADGQLLGSASADGTARLWEPATGWALGVLYGHRGAVLGLAFDPQGDRLATGGADGTVRVWRTPAGTAEETLKGHKAGVLAVAWSPDGRLLASGDRAGRLRLWQRRGRRVVRVVTAHEDAVTALCFTPGGGQLLSASEDGEVVLWDVATARAVARLAVGAGSVDALALDALGRQVASGGHDRVVRLIRLDALDRAPLVLPALALPITGLALSGDGARVYVTTWGPAVEVWDVYGGAPIERLEGHTDRPLAVALSPDGVCVATAGADRTVRIWPA